MLTLVAREDGIVVSVELTKTTERAARRAATAKAEKAYKEAKAEHIHKSALIGSRRYNGLYKPYIRNNDNLITRAYEEIEEENMFFDDLYTEEETRAERRAYLNYLLDETDKRLAALEAQREEILKTFNNL